MKGGERSTALLRLNSEGLCVAPHLNPSTKFLCEFLCLRLWVVAKNPVRGHMRRHRGVIKSFGERRTGEQHVSLGDLHHSLDKAIRNLG